MAIKLHTCGNTWIHGPHPCWKVMKALQDAGIEYEQVKNPTFPRGKRTELKQLSGQDKLPVIEFEDGRVLREESGDLAARIREGRLFEGRPRPADR
jgi:glutathione S-transferase